MLPQEGKGREMLQVRVSGQCMSPALTSGDLPFVLERKHYWPGDIVLVWRKRGFQTHRFLGYRPTRHGWAAVTQGDHEEDADPAAHRSRVWGRVMVYVSLSERWHALLRYFVAMWKLLRRERP